MDNLKETIDNHVEMLDRNAKYWENCYKAEKEMREALESRLEEEQEKRENLQRKILHSMNRAEFWKSNYNRLAEKENYIGNQLERVYERPLRSEICDPLEYDKITVHAKRGDKIICM